MKNFSLHSIELPKKQHHFRTFREWVHESDDGRDEIARGYYLDHIKDFLHYISRRNLFIVDFQSLVFRTNDTMYRIGSFLKIDPNQWIRKGGDYVGKGGAVTLPTPKYQHPDYPYGALDCGTFQYLRHHYSERNLNLEGFINKGSGHRSSQEPFFDYWNYSKPVCSHSSKVAPKPTTSGGK